MTPLPDSRASTLGSDAASMSSWLRDDIETAAAGVFALGAPLDGASGRLSFEARNLAHKRDVVVDVVPRPDEALANALLAGIPPYVALRHPHIGRVFGAQRVGDHVFVERQRPDGHTLADVLRVNSARPLPWVASVLAQVGAALEGLHRAGIEAGAPRPARIRFDAAGDAVLDDVARPFIERIFRRLGPVRPLSLDWAYCAPEEVTGSPEGAATDQYALACIAYELVAGVGPFGDLDRAQLVSAKLTEVPRPLRERRPDCPPALETAVARMLSREPGDRYASIADAMAAAGVAVLPTGDPLRGVVPGIVPSATSAPAEEPTPAIRAMTRYHNWWATLLAGLFVGYGVWSASTLRGVVGFLTLSPGLLPLTIWLPVGAMLVAYFALMDFRRRMGERLSRRAGRAAGDRASAEQEPPPTTYAAALVRALPGLIAGVIPVVLVGVSLVRATVADLAQRTPGVVTYEALLAMQTPPRVFSVDAPLRMDAEARYWPQQRSARTSADLGIAYVPLQSAAGEPVRYVMSTPRYYGQPTTEAPGPYLVHAVRVGLPIPVRRDLAGKGVRFAADVVLLDRLDGAGTGSEPSGNHQWVVPFICTGILPFLAGLLVFVSRLRSGTRVVRAARQSLKT